MITDRKEAVEYLMKNKKGRVKVLEEIIDSNLITSFKSNIDNYLKVDGKNYEITENGIEAYKYIYSDKANFGQKILGLFCHYILRFK